VKIICPRCGVAGKEEAEFCVSCGQSLDAVKKNSVSTIPPAKVSSSAPATASESNVINLDRIPSQTAKMDHGDARGNRPGSKGKSSEDQLRETILLHAPSSQNPDKRPNSRDNIPMPTIEQEAVRSVPPVTTKSPKEQASSIQVANVAAPLTSRMDSKIKRRKFVLRTEELPSLEVQRIWYKITENTDWNTVALIPASKDLCVLNIAHGLGTMAVREPCEFVRVLNASMIAYDSCEGKNGKSSKNKSQYPYEYFDLVDQLQPNATSLAVTQLTKELLRRFDEARESGNIREGKVFVTIDPFESHPDAIALSRVVNKLIIGVKLGQTKFEDMRQIISTVGKDRVLGCIAVR
jgi:hypothetical protein